MESSSVNGLCRCCASEGAFKDIKTSYHWMGEEEVYGDMLRECFDVNLSSADQGGICEVCITQLRNASNFKKQVLRTENQFKQHLRTNKGFKACVKEERSTFDDESDENDMDNIDDEDYVPEYEMPIKTESESEEKPKKRGAKTVSTRAKKSKSTEGDATVKNSRRSSSSDESDTPLIFVEENKITLDRKVNFTSFISILPADARKKTPSSATVDKPKKVEKHKENIIMDDLFEPMDHEPLEPLPKEPLPKRVERKRKAAPKPSRPKRKTPRPREVSEEKVRKRPVTEIEWHLENIKVILNSSNATPIRCRENGEYQCSYCKQHFEKLTDLKIHTLTSKSHKKKKPDFLKIHYASLSKHIVYLDITALHCSICQLEMISLEALMEHLKNDHDENMHLVIKNQIMPLRVVDEKLTCSVCGTEVEFEGIQEHMAQHYRNYVCEFCDTSFVIRSKMIDHKKAVHDL